MYQELANQACTRITRGIVARHLGERAVTAVLDPYNPTGSTIHVNFTTSKQTRWKTDPRRCHVNWVVCDSDWEAEFCRFVESHPQVRAYVKNHALGLDVPYRYGAEARTYLLGLHRARRRRPRRRRPAPPRGRNQGLPT